MSNTKKIKKAEKEPIKSLPSEIIEKIILNHENAIDDRMGHLYNRFVGYISEAKLPLPQIITVLNILLKDAMKIAEKKYKGDT